MEKSKQRVAIFDIDGTIFRSSLLIELVDALVQEGIFPASARKMYAKSFSIWLDRKGSYDNYIMDVVRSFLKNIKGVRYRDFARVSKKVIAFHKNRVYRYTRDLVLDLRKRNYYLIAISHSPMEAVEAFAKKELGFDEVYGKKYEVDKSGRFTGRVDNVNIMSDKAEALGAALAKAGLSLEDSMGVGDSETDIAFLEKVKHPICFNPNKELYEHAKISGWQVVVERKDVIYFI